MKINKVILSNIGAYLGHHEFNLTINHPKQNLILIGGKNGAGKTTLLESIRLALFGPYAYGFRTETEQYYKRITSLLNNTALHNLEKDYRIILEIERVENYERFVYTIKRTWNIESDKVKERFEVLKNNQYLNDNESEIFQSKLREETPPQLFELSLFDGEEIARLIIDNKLPEYIHKTARVLFNLDLFENLEDDILLYMKNESSKGNKSDLEIKYEQMLDELKSNKSNFHNLASKYESINKIITETQNEVDHLKKEFEVNGGLIKEERDKLLAKLSKIEHQRKANAENVRAFITGLLPIFLVEELLNDVKTQMKNEHSYEIFEQLSSSLKSTRIDGLVNVLKEMGLTSKISDQELELLLKEGFLSSIKPNGSALIHRASFNQRSEVEELLKQVSNIDTKHYIELFNKNQILLKEQQKLRKQIEENDKNHDFKDIFSNIQRLNIDIEKAKIELVQVEENLSDQRKEIEKISTEIERIKEKIIDSTKSENTLSLSIKISEISKKFRMLQIQKKLQQVEILASQMIQVLFRKEEFLHQVKIDPKTFEVTLLSPNQETIDQNSISAGEKELLLLTIIWSMFKSSGSRMPFVFDTLLGRLDETHRERLLLNLVPKFGEQVIILSTDSEINEKHYNLIKPIISKTYTLDYDKIQRKVILNRNKYFDLSELELSQ